MNNNQVYLELYKRHIAYRTGGVEDHKSSINDYVEEFHALIDDIRINGFDENYPIPVSRHNGIILDGAHRLACCLYFKKSAYVEYMDIEGSKWDYKWLLKNGFQSDLDKIYKEYIRIKSANTFIAILWGPIRNHWDEVERIISKKHTIVGRMDFSFSSSVFLSVLEEIYAYEFGIRMSSRIEEKGRFLLRFPSEFAMILFDVREPNYFYEDETLVCKQVLELKNGIRDDMNSIVEKERFATIHTSDNEGHTAYLSSLLLSENNLKVISNKDLNKPREEFLSWLEEYMRVMEDYGLSKEECCIVGSSSLEVLGIRKSTDIDFIISEQKRDSYFPDTFLQLSANVDIASRGYHEKSNKEITFTDNQIIFDEDKHFYFRGLKFAALDIIKDRKSFERRPKDMKDIMLIDEYLQKNLSKQQKRLWRSILRKVLMVHKIYIVAYFRHGFVHQVKRVVWRNLSVKQREHVKKYLGKIRKTI